MARCLMPVTLINVFSVPAIKARLSLCGGIGTDHEARGIHQQPFRNSLKPDSRFNSTWPCVRMKPCIGRPTRGVSRQPEEN